MKLGVEAIQHYNTLCVAPDLQDMVILYILLVCPREHIIEVWPGWGCDLFGTYYIRVRSQLRILQTGTSEQAANRQRTGSEQAANKFCAF
jgi:hypothetical protein